MPFCAMRSCWRCVGKSLPPQLDELLARASRAAPLALTQAIQEQSDEPAVHLARGFWYARHCLLGQAADDFANYFRLRPTDSEASNHSMQLAILLAEIGEADRYDNVCNQLVDRYGATSEHFDADATLKSCCLLGPAPHGDPTRLARLSEVALSADPAQAWYEWFLFDKSVYDYRAGRFDAALTACGRVRARIKPSERNVDALAAAMNAVEAMALHRSGDATDARHSLAEARKVIDEKLSVLDGDHLGKGWYDRLTAQFLYREALALFESDKNAPKKR
jgi:hypothetical protein